MGHLKDCAEKIIEHLPSAPDFITLKSWIRETFLYLESRLKQLEKQNRKFPYELDLEERVAFLEIAIGAHVEQHQKGIEKPQPEPATDKDGKPEGGLKYPDLVQHSLGSHENLGIFISKYRGSNWDFKVMTSGGLRTWGKSYTIFVRRPRPPSEDS